MTDNPSSLGNYVTADSHEEANARAFAIRAHNRTPDTHQSPRTRRTRAHLQNGEHRTAASAYPISTRPPPTTSAAGISLHPTR